MDVSFYEAETRLVSPNKRHRHYLGDLGGGGETVILPAVTEATGFFLYRKVTIGQKTFLEHANETKKEWLDAACHYNLRLDARFWGQRSIRLIPLVAVEADVPRCFFLVHCTTAAVSRQK